MKQIFSLLLTGLLLCACGERQQRDEAQHFMTMSKVEYVKSFPKTVELPRPTKIDVGVGIMEFKIKDSLLVFTRKGTSGVMGFYSLKTNRVLGHFFNVGNAQDEFVATPSVCTGVSVYRQGDTTFVDAFDSQKGRLLTLNLDKSIKMQKVCLTRIEKALSNNDFVVIRLNDGKYLVRTINDDATQQIRTVRDFSAGKTSTPKVMERLNAASVRMGEDFNILSCIFSVSPDGRIVEMPIGLNYLNIYTVDGSFAKTVCVGDELYDIDDIMRTSRANRMYTFADVRAFDNFFGVVRIDEDEKTYQIGKIKSPSILLFSLDGKPLAEIKMKGQVTSFDIDVENGFLYALDTQTDEFLRYDMKEFLDGLKRQKEDKGNYNHEIR